jgi:putative acetyltransferase
VLSEYRDITMDFQIRRETRLDADPIEAVTLAAFAAAKYSEHREHLIVRALRASEQLTVSLVAELDGRIVGHAAASPVGISDGTPGWFGLGPVAVVPDSQGRGIGSGLVRRTLGTLVERGAAGCVVLGEPDYYRRFGFRTRGDLALPGVPPEYFQAVAFGAAWPSGVVTYHRSFSESC